MSVEQSNSPDVFRVTVAGGPGLTRRQAQGRRFLLTSTGVRIPIGSAADPDIRVLAARIGCRQDVVLTDLSAARAWRLPLPWWRASDQGPVSLSVAAGQSRPRRADVSGRRLRLPAEHLTERGGGRITTPGRTWLDCAALIPLGHVVAMGDVVLRRGLATPDELREMCHWAFRRRGVGVARRALPLSDPRADSPGESLARVVLVSGGVPAPECNADVFAHGEWIARADMLWRQERLIVEYDGIVHLTERQRRYDAVRRNLLQEAGWYVIVFTARDLRHPEQMCMLVKQALRRGGSPRPAPRQPR